MEVLEKTCEVFLVRFRRPAAQPKAARVGWRVMSASQAEGPEERVSPSQRPRASGFSSVLPVKVCQPIKASSGPAFLAARTANVRQRVQSSSKSMVSGDFFSNSSNCGTFGIYAKNSWSKKSDSCSRGEIGRHTGLIAI